MHNNLNSIKQKYNPLFLRYEVIKIIQKIIILTDFF